MGTHVEFLVEEPSAESFLRAFLPRFIPSDATFGVHAFQGKRDLLGKLDARMAGYRRLMKEGLRIVVLVDEDRQDCVALKAQLETAAKRATLTTRSACKSQHWQVVNRIVIEELEAWYFGDWTAVVEAFPRLPRTVPSKAPYRNPDAIAGGTWEALEKLLKQAGYFPEGIAKLTLGVEMGRRISPDRNTSESFRHFYRCLLEAFPSMSPPSHPAG